MPSLNTLCFGGRSVGRRRAIVAGLMAGAICLQSDRAAAVSESVRDACMGDYFTYCSQHDVGSPALRRCMRTAGPKLSRGCVNALVAAGEIQGEVKVARAERRAPKARR